MKKYINLFLLAPLLVIPFVSNGCSTVKDAIYLKNVIFSTSDLSSRNVFTNGTIQLNDPYLEDMNIDYGSALLTPNYDDGNNWRNGNSSTWNDDFGDAKINAEYDFVIDPKKIKDDTMKWIQNFNTDFGGNIQLSWNIWKQIKTNDSHEGGKYILSRTHNSLYSCETQMELSDANLKIIFLNVPFNIWFNRSFSMGGVFGGCMGKSREIINEFDASEKNTYIADTHKNKYIIRLDNSLKNNYFSMFFQYTDKDSHQIVDKGVLA